MKKKQEDNEIIKKLDHIIEILADIRSRTVQPIYIQPIGSTTSAPLSNCPVCGSYYMGQHSCPGRGTFQIKPI